MENSENRVNVLRSYVEKHRKSLYKLVFKDCTINAYFNTAYDSDNGLEIDENGYEEYFCIAFQKVNDGTLFEVNYHNLPDEIYDGNVRVI